jgi:ketosteroid isomerase-like protein
MSEENVDLARRAYEAFNRRDLEAFLALLDDEVGSTRVSSPSRAAGSPSRRVSEAIIDRGPVAQLVRAADS